MTRRTQAGFTLTELVVSSAVGLFTLAVAVQVASHHSAAVGETTRQMDTLQSSRMVLDLISEDLRHAGAGVGYRPDGQFGGLIRGAFTVSGGAQFSAGGRVQTLTTGDVVTDDLGIRLATGDIRTVAAYAGVSGQICAGSNMAVGDVVMLLSREALHGVTVQLQSLADAACVDGMCRDGCATFTYAPSASYQSDAGAPTVNYVSGSMIGDFAEVVWFVHAGPDGDGELRRAEVTSAQPCATRGTDCGGLVADDVETMQVAVWQWDDAISQWVDRTASATVDDRRRLRVDIEVVVRGGAERAEGAGRPVALQLAPGQCVGGTCGGVGDQNRRFVMRTSVEVRNGGRMQIR